MKKNDRILLFIIILTYIALSILISQFRFLFDIKFYLLTVTISLGISTKIKLSSYKRKELIK